MLQEIYKMLVFWCLKCKGKINTVLFSMLFMRRPNQQRKEFNIFVAGKQKRITNL